MTRKHFEAIAQNFAHQNARISEWDAHIDPKSADGARSALLSLAQHMCSTFSTFNSNFNRATFLTACGF